MTDDAVKRRKTLTLGWRPEPSEQVAVCKDEYVASEEPVPANVEVVKQQEVGSSAIEDRIAFLERMGNWRRTVRASGGRGGGGGYCAPWARWYVLCRSKDKHSLRAFVAQNPEPPRVPVSVDQLDGWLVEAAVRSLPEFQERMVLQYWYVWQYPEHWIKAKLMLRRTGVKLLLARAENNLQKVLARLECLTYIHTQHFHAGNVPRPESKDAHVGAALTLKNGKALID